MTGGQSTLSSKASPCEFCKIANKEGKAHVVMEDSKTIAFLDIRPLFPGHVLLIPKKHIKNLSELPEDTMGTLFGNVKLLCGAIEKAMMSDGTFIAINDKVSQSVPHLHIHVVPRKFKDGLKGFFWPRYKYSGEQEMKKVQSKIIAALKG